MHPDYLARTLEVHDPCSRNGRGVKREGALSPPVRIGQSRRYAFSISIQISLCGAPQASGRPHSVSTLVNPHPHHYCLKLYS